MKLIGKVILWLFLWPILLPIWLWKRGMVGKVIAGIWVSLFLCVVVVVLVSPKRTQDQGTIAVATSTPIEAKGPAMAPTAQKGENTPELPSVPTPSDTRAPTDTPAPTSAPAPTNTPAPTVTPEPTLTFTPTPKPIILTGTGQTATDQFVLPSPLSVARFTHNGQSNFIVTSYQGGEQNLLINTIGAYRGERPLAGNEPIALDISADGRWTVEVRPIETADSPNFSGAGDAVSGLFAAPETGAWEIRHSGQGNFIVYLHCAGGSTLVQNEIGTVQGSRMVRFPAGPCLWEVVADGEWSLSPRGATRQEAATPSPVAGASTKATRGANLRSGPGTNYAVIGSVKAGDLLSVSGRSSDGKWLSVVGGRGEAWISTQLVEPVSVASLPVKASSAPTVEPAPQATAKPPAQFNASAFPQIGQEVEAGGWRFKVAEAHKRKAVYFYDSSYIAQGHFLILVIEATNLHPGTSYFAHDVDAYATDVPGNTYGESSKGSMYAQWMLGGADSTYTDVNPGVTVRMAVAYDLPDSLGDILLSGGKALKWVYLGNFAQMKSEDS